MLSIWVLRKVLPRFFFSNLHGHILENDRPEGFMEMFEDVFPQNVSGSMARGPLVICLYF